MPFPTLPAVFPTIPSWGYGRRAEITAADHAGISQGAHFTFAHRVKTLGGDTRVWARTINSAAWIAPIGVFRVVTGANVTRLRWTSIAGTANARVTLVAGAVTLGPYVNAHAGAASLVETVIAVNALMSYTCTVEVQNNGGAASYWTAFLREDDLTRADL